MRLITAVDESNAIGYKGKLPWHCSEDLKWFKFITTGCKLIVGRKTFETMKGIKNREFFIVSKMPDDQAEVLESKYNALVCDCLPTYYEEAIVCGGASIYELAFASQVVDEIYLSRIAGIHTADTYFPSQFLDGFRPVAELKLSDRCKVEKWVK
jgi:dihydrofolate reductase